jgi:transcriptional regulator with XRE-family HTH domain
MIILELLRRERRLTEAEAADLIGKSPVDYALIEHGLQEPDEDTGHALMAAFDCSYAALFVDVHELIEEALIKRDLVR